MAAVQTGLVSSQSTSESSSTAPALTRRERWQLAPRARRMLLENKRAYVTVTSLASALQTSSWRCGLGHYREGTRLLPRGAGCRRLSEPAHGFFSRWRLDHRDNKQG